MRVYTPYVYPNNANYGSAIKSVPSVEAGGEMTIVATSKPNYVFQKWEISNPTTCTDATIVTPDSPTSILRVGVTTPNVRAVFVAQSTEQPLVVVPTSYDYITERELIDNGINVVIYANHLLRASYPTMVMAAESILRHGRAKEASESCCMSIRDIITLIPSAGPQRQPEYAPFGSEQGGI